MGAKEIWNGTKIVVADVYAGGQKVGGDLLDASGRLLNAGGRGAQKIGTGVNVAYDAAARKLYEQGRFKLLHTSNSPVFYDAGFRGANVDARLVSIALPARVEGKYYRAPKTPKVLDLWDKDYPVVLLELEDPDPNIEGEEAIRLSVQGKANNALGNNDIAWRMWMPGRYQIKLDDMQGTVVEKPQAEMTAGDVVSLLAESVKTKSGGKLIVSHRDLQRAMSMISEKSQALEKRWAILNERLVFNKNLVNKPEEVAGAFLTMVLMDKVGSQKFVDAILNGTVIGWKSCVDQITAAGTLRVYGSFAGLMDEGQRMLPRPADPNDSFRVPARVLIGSYKVLQYVNQVVDNDKLLNPIINELATLTKTNQAKALAIGKAVLLARGRGFDEIRGRIEAATPQLAAKMGVKADEIMTQLGDQMSDQVDASNYIQGQVQGQQSNNQPKP